MEGTPNDEQADAEISGKAGTGHPLYRTAGDMNCPQHIPQRFERRMSRGARRAGKRL